MSSHSQRPWLEVEQVGPVTIARPTRSDLLDDQTITAMGRHLYSLVDDLGCRRLLLDLGYVRLLASAMLGKVIGLHKKLEKSGGRLAVCRVHPTFTEAFKVLHLDRLFGIYGGEQEALQSLQ
jgi:anti-sigma B factor antagonist